MSKYIKLKPDKLKSLRRERGLSQESASWECQRLRLHISEATFKRAEAGKAILYRTANDFAKLFNLPLSELINEDISLLDAPRRRVGDLILPETIAQDFGFIGKTEPSIIKPSILSTGFDETSSKVLLGRDFELLQFKQALNICSHQHVGRLLCIRGVPGIGKSRLLAEFKRIAAASNIAFITIKVKQTQGSEPSSALTELLLQLLDILPSQANEAFLTQSTTRFLLNQKDQFHFCYLLGIPIPSVLEHIAETLNFTEHATNEKDLLLKLISSLHKEKPCVIAFDDMLRSDKSLTLSLRLLSASIQNLPIILILATLSENNPIDAIWRSCVINTPTITLDLSPLNTTEAEKFAHYYQVLEPDYIQQAIHLSEGNPLFLEQLLMNYPCMVGCFPSDLRNLMDLRLKAMDKNAQTVLKAAAIIGTKIDLEFLDYMVDDIDYDLNRMIKQLIVRPLDADNIEFCHDLIRQGFYENIEQQEKLTFHAKAAQWYLEKDKRLYAKHLSLSERYKTPSAPLQTAGKQEKKHYYGNALSMIDKALSITSNKAESFRFYFSKGLILKQLDLPEKSLKCFIDALNHAENDQQSSEIYLEMAYTYQLLQRDEDALRVINSAAQYQSSTKAQKARFQCLLQQINSGQHNSQSQPLGVVDNEREQASSGRIAKAIQESKIKLDDLLSITPCQENNANNQNQQIIKIGLLHSQTGNLQQLEEGVIRTTLMAIGEINQNGGLLGHSIEPVIIDGKSSEDGFYAGAKQLVNNKEINTIFGCSISSSRRIIKPLIESSQHLLIYPFQYEGIEHSDHIFYVGPAPNQTALPAIEWLFHKQHHNFYLLGSDYVYPRATNLIIKEQLCSWRLNLTAENYVQLGCSNFNKIIEDIKHKQPDVVVLTLVGLSTNREFFRQFHQAGLETSKITLLSLVLSENDLIDIPTESVAGTHAVFSYFQNIDNPINEQFVRRYKHCFGNKKQVGGYMESAYVGVYLWAKAVQKAKSFERSKIIQAMKGVAHFGPGGIAYIDENNNHVWRHVQIAKVGEDGEFQPLWRSQKPIKPEPFPLGLSPLDWTQKLERIQREC